MRAPAQGSAQAQYGRQVNQTIYDVVGLVATVGIVDHPSEPHRRHAHSPGTGHVGPLQVANVGRGRLGLAPKRGPRTTVAVQDSREL